jgi:hypothetical protein
MAIKLYKSQLEPTARSSNVMDTRRISMSEAGAIGNAMKGMLKAGENLYEKHQQVKSETEVKEKIKEIMVGTENNEGLASHKLKASNMDDPDKAVSYFANEVKKVQDTNHNFNGLFSKKIFKNWVNKQGTEDLITIKANSTKLFLEKARSTELDYLTSLSKKVLYGSTPIEKDNAAKELKTRLETKSAEIFGSTIGDVKKKISRDIAFFGYKNVSVADQAAAMEMAEKDDRLDIEDVQKLKTHFKTSKSSSNNLNKDNVKKMESALESGIIFDGNEYNTAVKIATDGNDQATLLKLKTMAEDANTYVQLSTMSVSELENRENILVEYKNKKLRDGEGVGLKEARNLEITRKFLAKLTTDLNKDQMKTAHDKGIITLNEIGFQEMLQTGDLTEFASSISTRISKAKTVGAFYNREVKFFTANEEKQIKDAFNSADNAKDIIRLSTTLVNGFGVDSDIAFKQLSKDNTFLSTIGGLTIMNDYAPSANVNLAVEGYLISKNEELKNIYKIKTSDTGYLSKVAKYQTTFLHNEDTFNNIVETANYIYMAQLRDSGKTTNDFDANNWEKAFIMASGGVNSDYNILGNNFSLTGMGGYDNDTRGNQVHIPSWLQNGKFSSVVEAMEKDETLWLKASKNGENAIIGDGSMKGNEITLAEIFKEDPPYFVSIGNGKYRIAMGEDPTGNGEPEYLMSSDSTPNSQLYFIININNIKDEILTGMK